MVNLQSIDLVKVSDNRISTGINNQFVIIGQTIDFFKDGTFLTPDNKFDYSDNFQFFDLAFYCYKELKYKHLPFHYYLELFKDNYTVISGSPFHQKSNFLKDLGKEGLISNQYENAVYITLQGDYNTDVVERRVYKELAYFLSGICFSFKIPLTNILFLYDLVEKNKSFFSFIIEKEYTFNSIKKMKHFDKDLFFSECKKFGIK